MPSSQFNPLVLVAGYEGRILKPGAPSQLLPDLLPACQLETLDLAHYTAKQDHSLTKRALQALQSNYMQQHCLQERKPDLTAPRSNTQEQCPKKDGWVTAKKCRFFPPSLRMWLAALVVWWVPLSPWFAVSTAKVLRVLLNPLDPLGWSGLSVSALGGKDSYLGDEAPSSNGCQVTTLQILSHQVLNRHSLHQPFIIFANALFASSHFESSTSQPLLLSQSRIFKLIMACPSRVSTCPLCRKMKCDSHN